MKRKELSHYFVRGGTFVWFLVMILVGAIIWGGVKSHQDKVMKERLAYEERQRQIREKNARTLEENERKMREIKEKREAERARKQQEKEELRKKQIEEQRKAEEAQRRAAEEEEARRRAQEEADRQREQNQEDDTGDGESPDPSEIKRDSVFPDPVKNPLPDLSVYDPKSKDEIPMDEDKVIGKWSWESAEKYDLPDFPTESSKWKDRSQAIAMAEKYEKWRKEDSKIKASPSAKDFPGLPEEGAPLVTRTIKIDSNISGWHSTGLYAPPGAQITFSIGSGPKDKLSVRIGCHTDNLIHKEVNQWMRLPIMGNTKRVVRGHLKLADPCGGLVYVCVDGGIKRGRTFSVKISGATPAPLYILGETTPEQWKKQLEETKAPWGEIRTPRLIFTMPTESLKKCEKIKEVAELLQKCMALQDWVAGWDEFPDRIKAPMRFVVDRQISIGAGHSGYPAMGYMDWDDALVDGSILTSGSWGLWHELGHNHQGAPFAMEGQTEVSVNIFSMVCQAMGVGISPTEVRGMSPDSMAPGMSTYITDKNLTYNTAENITQLFLWGELMYYFGCESFRKVNLEYIKRPYDNGTTSDKEKWNWVMKTFGKVLKKDLSMYFEVWKLPIDKSTRGQLKKWDHWQPIKNYPGYYYGLDEGEPLPEGAVQPREDD